MFKRILVPIISDHFPENALKRACMLSSRYEGELFIVSILSEKLMDRLDTLSSHVIMGENREELQKEIIRSHQETARRQVFKRAEDLCLARRIAVKKIAGRGDFSQEILKAVDEHHIDSIVMEYSARSASAYSIFEKSPVPVWIEQDSNQNSQGINTVIGNTIRSIFSDDSDQLPEYSTDAAEKNSGGTKNETFEDEVAALEREVIGNERLIVGICSNRAPNLRVPKLLESLSNMLGARSHVVYVVDEGPLSRSDSVQQEAQQFVCDMNTTNDRRIGTETFTSEIAHGSILGQVLLVEHRYHPWLIILGRIRESDLMLSLERDTKHRIADKIRTNILLAK